MLFRNVLAEQQQQERAQGEGRRQEHELSENNEERDARGRFTPLALGSTSRQRPGYPRGMRASPVGLEEIADSFYCGLGVGGT